jgi:hypothetical protein
MKAAPRSMKMSELSRPQSNSVNDVESTAIFFEEIWNYRKRM